MNDFNEEDDDAEINCLSCAARIALAIDNLEGRSELLYLIAQKHAKTQDFNIAFERAEQITDSYLRDQALGELAASCIRADAADYGEELSEMIEDDAAYAVATEQMAVAYAEAGAIDRAVEVAERLAEPGPALSRVGLACVAGGHSAQALELVRSIDYPDLQAPVLLELAAKAIQDGYSANAVEVLAEATDVTKQIEFFEQRISAHLTIASLEKKLGREEQALKILLGARDLCLESEREPARDPSLAQIAASLAELRHFDQADQVIEEIENALQFARALVGVALEHHQADNRTKALALLNQASEIVRAEDVYGEQTLLMREAVLDELARAYVTAGHYDEGVETIGLMSSQDQQSRTLGQIGIMAVTSEHHDRAFKVVESIEDEYARVLFEANVVDAFIRAGQLALADRMLAQAFAHATAIARPYPKAAAMIEAAPRFAHREQSTKATEVLVEALNVAATIEDSYQQALVLINLAGKYLELGKEPGEREQTILKEIVRKLD